MSEVRQQPERRTARNGNCSTQTMQDMEYTLSLWMKRAGCALGAALLALPALAAQEWEAQVRRVVDGDTIWVTRDKGDGKGERNVKLRLRGIDAPEMCQDGGEAARRALQQLAKKGQRVQVRVIARDQYGRSVADVWREGDGENLAARMVEDGWAWSGASRRRPGRYAAQQKAAQSARRGVFADGGALHPTQFRRQHGPCQR